ncbi:MAG TPA: DUF3127 domain-containing protein [Bacteroidales bacterium]|jgi:hypothetical protein|nr:DUF3127 domain-containing protein [Bacteroidales bacterium]HQJ81069.1 DUF3127 domain-containing protein [Bacteroidales bacterium]
MAFEITGKIIDISPVNQISDKFRKREFVIERKETGGSTLFIDYIKFQLIQDKCDLINESFMNEEVRILFNIRGNRWERDGRVNYFTNLDAWKIERISSQGPEPEPEDLPQPEDMPPEIDDLSDLPF